MCERWDYDALCRLMLIIFISLCIFLYCVSNRLEGRIQCAGWGWEHRCSHRPDLGWLQLCGVWSALCVGRVSNVPRQVSWYRWLMNTYESWIFFNSFLHCNSAYIIQGFSLRLSSNIEIFYTYVCFQRFVSLLISFVTTPMTVATCMMKVIVRHTYPCAPLRKAWSATGLKRMNKMTSVCHYRQSLSYDVPNLWLLILTAGPLSFIILG